MTGKRRIVIMILAAAMFLAGLGMLLYPFAANAWNTRRDNRLISEYLEQVAATDRSEYEEWFTKAYEYNASLVGSGVPDAFAYYNVEKDSVYLSQLAYRDDGIMGYITIPKIDVNLPIYHTTAEDVLEQGIGHLQGSSLPVGGASTHCVLLGHRGLPSAELFTDLDLLEIGDHFYLHVLDETLAYEVDQILDVAPTETDSLAITEGEDYVTLMTCTPYGVNTRRLLVRGHRVDYDAGVEAAEGAEPVSSMQTRYGLWALLGIAFAVLFVAVLVCARSLCRRRHTRTRE